MATTETFNSTFSLKQFDYSQATGGPEWFMQNWVRVTGYAIGIYLTFIYLGTKWMKSRKAYNLRKSLVTWNIVLSVLSSIGAIVCGWNMFPVFHQVGFYGLVCDAKVVYHDRLFYIGGLLLSYSKIIELGDTVFIVLRKQPLIFLHYYHHVSVLLYTTYAFISVTATGLIFGFINMTVHGFMYTYYALKASKYRIPRPVSMTLTLLQIFQMIMAVYVTWYCFSIKRSGLYCDISDDTLKYAFLMYVSYFLLFSHFFYNAYFGGRSVKKVPEKSQ